MHIHTNTSHKLIYANTHMHNHTNTHKLTCTYTCIQKMRREIKELNVFVAFTIAADPSI